MRIFRNRETGRVVCLLLVVCLWIAYAQKDDAEYLMTTHAAITENSVFRSGGKVITPIASLPCKNEIVNKSKSVSRTGSDNCRNSQSDSAVVIPCVSIPLLKPVLYMSYGRHLHFSFLLIRYIQDQNGL